jgi:hypothetical protein
VREGGGGGGVKGGGGGERERERASDQSIERASERERETGFNKGSATIETLLTRPEFHSQKSVP